MQTQSNVINRKAFFIARMANTLTGRTAVERAKVLDTLDKNTKLLVLQAINIIMRTRNANKQ